MIIQKKKKKKKGQNRIMDEGGFIQMAGCCGNVR